jgi:hypothetical protein
MIETDKATAIALQKMREAFYNNYNTLDVAGIIEAIEEYVSARLKEKREPAAPYDPRLTEEYEAARLRQPPQGRIDK